MEINSNGVPNPDDLSNQKNESVSLEHSADANSGDVHQMDASENTEENSTHKRKHHDDHHVNRKYRIFSNHSSYGDSPHTNTSF